MSLRREQRRRQLIVERNPELAASLSVDNNVEADAAALRDDVLADVVEIVGDRALNVAIRVIPQMFEQRKNRGGIALERPQPGRPG